MTEDLDTRRCPFCAEDVKREAIVCRYCGRDIHGGQAGTQVYDPNTRRLAIGALVVIVVVIVGYVVWNLVDAKNDLNCKADRSTAALAGEPLPDCD